jgi:Ni,Fe-hydrogenase I cytochrome b subunit
MERKKVGREQTSGETKKERECEMEHYYERVAVWAINLIIGHVFMIARERIIRDIIKMNIKIISRI